MQVSAQVSLLAGLPGTGSPLAQAGGQAGAAVLGVDLVGALDDSVERSDFGFLAPGQELVVGVPVRSSQPTPGEIHWFYVTYSQHPAEPWADPQHHRWEHGGSFTPSIAPNMARFGASIAAPRPSAWGAPVPYVVVGAPGERAVYVIVPDPDWDTSSGPAVADPFGAGATVTRILGAAVGASGGSLFGEVVWVDDLDFDGIADLVVGAPGNAGGGTGGRVYVLPGTAPGVFSTSAAFSIRVGGAITDAANNELGASIASGPLHHPDRAATLVIGAPAADVNGAVCTAWFDDGFPSGASTHDAACIGSPFWVGLGFSSGQRFGASVAAANFIVHDSFGGTTSIAARLGELAVGAPFVEPAARNIHWETSTLFYEPAATGHRGAVTVFRGWPTVGPLVKLESLWLDEGVDESDPEDPVVVLPQELLADTFFLQQVSHEPGGMNSELGASMVVADVAPTTGWPDLLIGSPGLTQGFSQRGAVTVTRTSLAVNGYDDLVAGTYSAVDGGGEPVNVKVLATAEGYRFFLDGFRLRLVDESDDVCEHTAIADPISVVSEPVPMIVQDDPLGPPVGWVGELVFNDGGGSPLFRFKATTTHDPGAGTLTLALDLPRVHNGSGWTNPWSPRDCRAVTDVGSPYLLTDRQEQTCEF